MTTTRFPKIRRIAYGLSAAMTLSAGSGCIESKTNPTPETPGSLDWSRSAALTVATSCEEAETWLEDSAITQMDMQLEANRRCFINPEECGWFRGGIIADMGEGAPSAGADNNANDDQTPDEYSETNTQVDGVDESDRVKTDGEHIYALSNRDFVVVKSWPAAQTDELSRIRLRTQPYSFFLDGNRAVVLGHGNLYDVSSDAPQPVRDPSNGGDDKPGVPASDDRPAEDGGSSSGSSGADSDGSAEAPSDGDAYYPEDYRGYRSVTTVTIIDLTDRANPRIVKEHFFDGYILDSRRIDNKVYLAQNNYVYFDNIQTWPNLNWNSESDRPSTDVINAAFDELRAANVASIRARTLNEWLPLVWSADNGGDVAFASGRPATACTDIHVPNVFSGQGLLTLASLDLDDGSVTGSTIQGQWGSVYASLDAIYIGSTNWDFFWWWRGSDEVPPVKTHIHKFAFDTAGDARYTASGEVLGYAINQFAFDEYNGHLRVATTDGFGWWNNEETESRVTVLRQDGTRLAQTGLVTGLGVGERIFSVRFIRDQGYVVTFRQVDPLYVINLADPTKPAVTGELKIPGFSSYIHPLADGFLLTAGRDGDDEGNIGGVKIEIFDVRDPTDPKSVKTAVIGDGWNTWSDVLWDHKAFTYFGARNLLAIPVSGWVQETDTDGRWWGEYKSELALFRISTSDIEVLPSISHMSFFDDFGGNESCRAYSGYWQASIYRGVFVEDYVYSLSELGMQVHDTRTLDNGPVAEVTLLDPENFPYYDWGWCDGGGGVEPGDDRGEPTEPEPVDPEGEDPADAEPPREP